MSLEQELRAGIESSLRLQLEENAVFLSERLFAEFPSQSSLLTVAECYRTSGDSNTALRLLRHHSPFTQLVPETMLTNNNHPHNSSNNQQQIFAGSFRWKLCYLHGVIAAKLHLYMEADRILTPLLNCPINIVSNHNNDNNSSSSSEDFIRKCREDESAVKYWLGICGCHQGEASAMMGKPANYFGQSVTVCPAFFCSFQEAVKRCDAMQENNHPYSPSVVTFLMNQDQQQQQQQQQGSNNNNATATNNNTSVISRQAESRRILSTFLLPFAEVVRLLNGSYDCPGALSLVLFTSNNAVPTNSSSSSSSLSSTDAAAAVNNNQLINQPRPHLSSHQRFSGWSLEQAALAYFHSGRTQDAVSTFEQLRQREPWRLNTPSMVYFSTCLWHARNEVALCALAQKMIENIPRSPYTLCVVGNCHSLNRDSRVAATMFSRANSIEPTFAYAHTLRGHELLALEDVSDSETAFYEALKWDHRHYAAFAGLGELYFRTEKEGPARENFRSALKINGTLPAVLCRLAATYHRIGANKHDLDIALTFYEASLQRCPSHLPSQQQKATILVRLGRLDEAREMLTKLLATSPEEPSLHVAYGKCLAKMGNQDAAIKSFHRAMDLDPRRQASIKVLLDRVAAKKDVDG